MIQKLRYVFTILFIRVRILKYKFLSEIYKVEGNPILNQPVLMMGKGAIRFGNNVVFGTKYSPGFFNSYIYLEARTKESYININDEVWTNNNLCIISNGAGISIGKNTLIGYNVEILDSDFHEIDPNRR